MPACSMPAPTCAHSLQHNTLLMLCCCRRALSVDSPRYRARGATEFEGAEKIRFGDIAERPPDIKVRPKKKQRVSVTNIARMGTGEESEDSEAEEEARDAATKAKQKEQAKMRMIAMLRERAQAAYKQSKQRKRDQARTAKLDKNTQKLLRGHSKSSSLW